MPDGEPAAEDPTFTGFCDLYRRYHEAGKAVLQAGRIYEADPSEMNLRRYNECTKRKRAAYDAFRVQYDSEALQDRITALSEEDHIVTMEKLRQYGADTKTGLQRCMDKESFYLRLIQMTLDTLPEKIAEIHRAIDSREPAAAYEAAHDFKELLYNLAITPLLEPVSELHDLYRPFRRKTVYSMPAEKDWLPLLASMDLEAIRLFEALRADS